eukprot:gene9745-6833_t
MSKRLRSPATDSASPSISSVSSDTDSGSSPSSHSHDETSGESISIDSATIVSSLSPLFIDSNMSATDGAPAPQSIEAQLDRLNIDPDLKASILEMDPDTQREMLNDIIRNRNMENMNGFLLDLVSRPDGGEAEEEEEGEPNPAGAAQFTGLLPMLLRMARPPGGSGSERSGDVDLTHLMLQLRQHLMVSLQASRDQQEMLHQMGIDKDIDDMTYEELLELEEKMGSVSKGLTEAQVPTVLEQTPTLTAADGPCSICQDQLLCETLEDGQLEVSRIKNCQHLFHTECIKGWLKENKICPICRVEVLTPESQAAANARPAALKKRRLRGASS